MNAFRRAARASRAFRFRLVVLVLFAAMACPFARAGEDERLTKLLVGFLPVTGHAKLFIAREQGFFADERLDVELIAYSNSADGLSALRAGKLDVAVFGTVAPLVHVASGADLRIIGGIMGEDAYVVALPETAARIRNPEDMRGMTAGSVRLSSGDAVMREAIRQRGMSWKTDMNVIELQTPASVLRAVKNRQVDVGLVWGPYDYLAREQGMKVVFATADMFPGHPCCRVIVRTELLERKPSVCRRFMRAILRAEKFARDPALREQVIADIHKYLELDPAIIEQCYFHGKLDQASDPNVDGVKRMWAIINDVGVIDSPLKPSQYVVLEPYAQALRELIAEQPDEPYWRDLWRAYEIRNVDAMEDDADAPAAVRAEGGAE